MTDETTRSAVRSWIEEHQEEMLADLMALMRIDSSAGEPEEGAPFGLGVKRVFDEMAGILKRSGFSPIDYDGCCMAADFSDAPKELDILCHLDVVPGQEGWQVTEPFVPRILDGQLYGRGSSDDKGPAVAALYALRAIRELGLPMEKSARLILGGCEESGDEDMERYYRDEPYAPCTISPDSDFPVVNVEKGIMGIIFTGEVQDDQVESGVKVLSLHAGLAPNMIPSLAEAKVLGLDERAAEMAVAEAERDGLSVSMENGGDALTVTVTGTGCHASTPELGVNALTGLLRLLEGLDLDRGSEGAVRALNRLFPFGESNGRSLGVEMSDETAGALTLAFTVLHWEDGALTGKIDARTPLCAAEENCLEPAVSALEKAGFRVLEAHMAKPHYIPADSPLVQTLLASYEAVTGVRKEPRAIGGCTYIHGFPNAAAFGCMEPEVDNRIHGQDEFIDIDHLLDCACILAEAILRICG